MKVAYSTSILNTFLVMSCHALIVLYCAGENAEDGLQETKGELKLHHKNDDLSTETYNGHTHF